MACYLAGPMAGRSYAEITGWRKDAAKYLDLHDVETINPARDIDPAVLGGPTPLEGAEESVRWEKGAFFARDRNDVLGASLILANFHGATVPSIGTLIELGWASAWDIPIVVVGADWAHDHAFIRRIALLSVHTLAQGLEGVLSILNIERKCAFEKTAMLKLAYGGR